MTPERYQQMDRLYQEALERPVEERAAFLDAACAGDEVLRREVESLLGSYERAGSFLETPPDDVAAEMLAEEQAKSAVGQSIGPYKIVCEVGHGGMGEVYLAQDSRLGRKVALKLLPDYFTNDKERVRRFQHEARAASALSHPNVATIYDVGEADGASYIAMEYVQGQTLDAKINGRPLEATEIIDIAAQVADALDEAHSKGITHRDIKPGNIMLTPRGQVKVLDFGLAKVTRREEQALGSDISTQMKTEPGLVMGTVAYMSPEQALGRAVDHRTDFFSLGVVLYEMTTGQRPFGGSTTGETLDAIIHAEPEAIGRFNSNAPAELERMIRKCLEKEPDRRYQSARELVIDLRNLKRAIESGAAKKVAPEWWHHLRRWALAALTLVILAVVSVGLYRLVIQSQTIDSVAVLPFVNASADPNMEYLSDGITESLINSLSQLPNLRVMSRSSVFRYKRRETDAQVVGRELSVRAVLTGQVVQRGDGLTISIELVDARDNSHIWGEQYNRKVSDILAVQAEISEEVSEKLRLRLSGEEKKRVTKRYTENTEAYQAYLKGRYFLNKMTEEGLKKGIEYFQQAIDLDPSYAPAYAGLASSYELIGGVLGFLSSKEFYPRAKAAAMKALEIDDTLAEAHASLADYRLLYERDWVEADREYKRAIELNPNYAPAHQGYGSHLEALGRFDEAIAERKRAQELDPLTPGIVADVGYPLYYAREYDQAIEHYRRALELDPNFSWSYLFIGQAYVQKGMYEAAIAEIKKAITLSPGNTRMIATLGHAYAVSGKKSEAQKVLDELKGQSKRRYVSPYFIALIYTGLEEKDQAFAWLEKAYEERHPYLILLKVEPVFDSLRSDPRFTDLLRRVGLSP